MRDTLEPATGPAVAPGPPTEPRARWARRGLVLLVSTPVIVALVASIFTDYQPAADWALIELSVRDVGSHTPLLGPFSRYGWNHPGPLLFWTLAVPYRLFGSSPESLLIGAGLINLGSVVGIEALAWRRGRWPLLLLASLGVALLLHGVGAGFLVDPWNPYLTMLPFGALVFVVWSIACGEVRLTPVAVVLAAFLVQTHVGYVPVVGALLAWALIGLWWSRRDRPAPEGTTGRERPDPPADDQAHEPTRPWLVGSGVLALVLFSPLLVEQATNRPGNLIEIIRHFTERDEVAAGFGRAARVMGQHLALPGVWSSGDEPLDPFVGELVGGTGWWMLPAVVALAVAAGLAWRAHLQVPLRLLATVAIGLVVGLVTISRTTDAMFPYLFQWMRPLSMTLWLVVVWVIYLVLTDDWRARVGRIGAPVVVAATAVLAVLTSLSSTAILITEGPVDDAVVALAPDTIGAVGDGPTLIWPVGGCLDWVANGLVLELERAGVDVRAPEGDAHRYGEHRIYDGTNAQSSVVVACREEIDAFADAEGFEEVARFSPLTSEEEQEFVDAAEALRREATDEGRDDLVPYIDNGAIALFGPGTGLDEGVLARFRALQPAYDERVVVYLGPPIDAESPP